MGRPRKNNSPIISFFRSIFTVTVLSAFVLGISFFVKTLATSDSRQLLSYVNPVLSRLNINSSRMSAVAGAVSSRLTDSTQIVKKSDISTTPSLSGTTRPTSDTSTETLFKVAILSDSHEKNDNLSQALSTAKNLNVTTAFYLGDFTDLGVVDALQKAKKAMDASGVEYYALPGDHDLYQSVGPQNFLSVFGRNHFTKTINGIKFVGLDNSANYTLINDDIMTWFKTEVANADFVLLSQPLYHPTLDVVMGVVQGKVDPQIKAQAEELLKIIRASNAKAIIAGDQHMSSQNPDPTKSTLQHIVVGALTDERNLQTPRFSILTVTKDGGYKVEDVLLK